MLIAAGLPSRHADGTITALARLLIQVNPYLSSDGKAFIRVRIKDNSDATLTIKSRYVELRRLELEYVIPTLEAEAMIPLRRGSVIEKVRHDVPFGGLVWEVDEFAGENDGLALAEVELEQEHQRFEQPS